MLLRINNRFFYLSVVLDYVCFYLGDTTTEISFELECGDESAAVEPICIRERAVRDL